MRRLAVVPAALVAAAALLLGTAVPAVGGATPPVPGAGVCLGAGSHHATIVVEHGTSDGFTGTVIRRCVAFDGDAISGEQLLRLSGISFVPQSFGSLGDAVCQLDGEPKGYTQCPGADFYWAYFVSRHGGAWQFSSLGMSEVTLADGDAEGFRYISTSGSPSYPPSPAGICPAATPAPTAPPAPTARPTARPTALPAAATPSSTATATASTEPTATPSAGRSDAETAAPSHTVEASPSPSPSPGASTGPTGGAGAADSTGGGTNEGILVAGIGGVGLLALAIGRGIRRRRSGP